MKLAIVFAIAALFACSVHQVASEKHGQVEIKSLKKSLENKVLGAWEGQTGCTGDFLFRADGSYELKGHGPAVINSAGLWSVRWDVLPPTLVLTCKNSEFLDEIGQITEVKLLRLDDEGLDVRYSNHSVDRFARVKKPERDDSRDSLKCSVDGPRVSPVGAWDLRGSDASSNQWIGTFVLRELSVGNLTGYVDWIGDKGNCGREHLTAEYDKDSRQLTFVGAELQSPERIVRGTYVATLSDDGSELRNGKWGSGPDLTVPGEWNAKRIKFR